MLASAAELAIVHQARAGLSFLRRTRDDRRRLVRPQRVRAALATEVAHEHLARVRLRQPRLVTRVLLPLARVRARRVPHGEMAGRFRLHDCVAHAKVESFDRWPRVSWALALV